MLKDPRQNDMRRPLLFTQDHLPLWLGNIYRGRSAFLIGGGPSFAFLHYAKLRQPGILTMAMNNAVKTFRPHLWVSVDAPDHFLRSIWLDPTIMKFVPFFHGGKYIFNSDEWKFTGVRVGDCPNVVYFKQNDRFRADQFLTEDCLNWGNSKEHGGGLSVMLPAIRILFILGIRPVSYTHLDVYKRQLLAVVLYQLRAPGQLQPGLRLGRHHQPIAGGPRKPEHCNVARVQGGLVLPPDVPALESMFSSKSQVRSPSPFSTFASRQV